MCISNHDQAIAVGALHSEPLWVGCNADNTRVQNATDGLIHDWNNQSIRQRNAQGSGHSALEDSSII